MIAEPLARVMGNPVVVENRPGARHAARHRGGGEGRSRRLHDPARREANIAFNAGPLRQAAVRPARPISCRSGIATLQSVYAGRAQRPAVHSLKEILDYARANPGKLTYASAGNGTGQHITAAVTFHLAGVQVTHVPYKGAAPAYQDLIPGRVDLFFDNSATAQPHIEARRA